MSKILFKGLCRAVQAFFFSDVGIPSESMAALLPMALSATQFIASIRWFMVVSEAYFMSLILSIVSREPVVHVAGRGEASSADFPISRPSPFEPLLGADWAGKRILLNMADVPYLDSSAIGWLIQTQKLCRAAGGYLVLHSVQPAVGNVLNMLRIERVVPMAADEAAGRELLAREGSATRAA